MKLVKPKLLTALALGLVLGSNVNAADDSEKNPCGALLCILGGQTSGECAKYYKYYTVGIVNETRQECKNAPQCITATLPLKQLAHLKNCKLQGADSAGVKIDESLASSYGVTSFNQGIESGSTLTQMSGVEGECTKDELNRVEKKLLNNFTYNYRINPTQTKACQVLAGQTYSTIKVKYTCDRKWYSAEDWNNGFEKELVSKAVYEGLNSNDRGYYITYKDTSLNSNNNCVTLSPAQQTKYKVTTYLGWSDDMNYQVTKCRYQEIITNYYKKNYIKKDCWEVEQAY